MRRGAVPVVSFAIRADPHPCRRCVASLSGRWLGRHCGTPCWVHCFALKPAAVSVPDARCASSCAAGSAETFGTRSLAFPHIAPKLSRPPPCGFAPRSPSSAPALRAFKATEGEGENHDRNH